MFEKHLKEQKLHTFMERWRWGLQRTSYAVPMEEVNLTSIFNFIQQFFPP